MHITIYLILPCEYRCSRCVLQVVVFLNSNHSVGEYLELLQTPLSEGRMTRVKIPGDEFYTSLTDEF